jgi:Flp pilus assembly protein TadG
VEMAFVTVFLLILVMGIIDIGRALYTNISIQEAAQEGAYFGAFQDDATVAGIQQKAVNSTDSPALVAGDVTVNCTTVTKSKKNGTRVEVTVTHELDLVTPFVGQWLGGAMTLTKTAEAERFFSTCPA